MWSPWVHVVKLLPQSEAPASHFKELAREYPGELAPQLQQLVVHGGFKLEKTATGTFKMVKLV